MKEKICEIDLSLKQLLVPGIFSFSFFLQGFMLLFNGYPAAAKLPLICGCVVLAPFVIKYMNTDLILFEDRLVGKTGVINTRSINVPLEKINGVAVEQGLLGKMLSYKTIVVSTSSNVVKFQKVTNADQFAHTALDQVEKFKRAKKEEEIEMLAAAMKKSK